MPNHITNYVEITGDVAQVDALRERCLKYVPGRDEPDFDFNGVIPMPEALHLAAGSDTDLGMACFDQATFDRYHGYPWFPERYPEVASPEQLRAVLEQAKPETVAAGAQAMANLAAYGAPTWYEWCIQHWGTKWNAYETQVLSQTPGRLVLQFDTAWESPEPIFVRLEADGLVVNCYWQDEDPGNYGTYGEPHHAFDRHLVYKFTG